ncbi:MAG: hypothetical protein JXB49_00850 [Bacteroidales bacterium]|nr:hypothetical protein [Bacteroidales bacterium]
MMKSINIRLIISLLGIVTLFASCDKNNNEDVDVIFTAGSYIHQVSEGTFYKYVNSKLVQITSVDTTPVGDVNLAMYGDTIFAQADGKITVVLGQDAFFRFDGRADGIVLYPGDSTTRGVSHIYDDWPEAIGTSIELDAENVGEAAYEYREAGVYVAKMFASNYRDIEHDRKDLVKQIEVTVIDNADFPYIAK